MFTGIIEELGTIQEISQALKSITVRAHTVLDGTKIGDSIAVDGVCLTVVKKSESFFMADLSEETFERTHLGERRVGDKVNLERALRLADRLGGHLVSGHIDGVGSVLTLQKETAYTLMQFQFPQRYTRYVVEKGSIAIDGASLTVACVNSNTFSVALIPHTLRQTTLQYLSPGVNVNLEFDLLAKYVEKLLSPAGENAGKVPDREENHSRLTFDFLRENGF